MKQYFKELFYVLCVCFLSLLLKSWGVTDTILNRSKAGQIDYIYYENDCKP